MQARWTIPAGFLLMLFLAPSSQAKDLRTEDLRGGKKSGKVFIGKKQGTEHRLSTDTFDDHPSGREYEDEGGGRHSEQEHPSGRHMDEGHHRERHRDGRTETGILEDGSLFIRIDEDDRKLKEDDSGKRRRRGGTGDVFIELPLRIPTDDSGHR